MFAMMLACVSITPFGSPGRAGRVDDRRDVARIHPLRLIVERASDAPPAEDLAVSSSSDLVQAEDRCSAIVARRRRRHSVSNTTIAAEPGHVGGDAPDLGELLRSRDRDQRGAAVLQDERDLRRLQRRDRRGR